ncbi:tonsoku-like protein [Onthophagus taurus]|uniref:tonsoku-like protein n=1 Tax=Onthophagus taurus TaxID=166361 RepID=UPI0039BDB79E
MEEQKLIKRKKKVLNENNPSNTISAILNLAQFYFKEERYEEAIDEFKQAARQNKALNKLIDYGICHRMIGEAYLNIRKFEKALEHQQIHLQISKQEKNKLEEQRALATIGHTYLTSYLEGTNHDNKTPLHFAYKIFMKSLGVCESLTDISKREHMDMMSRLFANLGIVQESLINFDKALELVMKSVTISKNYDLHEQLQRNHCLLGSIYTKMGSFSNAIHEYNLSMEIAGRLPDKIKLISSALLSKSDLLVKLGDYHGAKTALLKAYKLKNPSEYTKDLIERNLKTVVAMCYTEEKLSTTADTDHESRKKLYEKMGDGSSALNCYSKAIEYYEKMLDSAIKNGDTGKNLSPAYVSLAQTYLDNKQYDLAIEYFEKDFNVNQLDTKEATNSLFSIIEAMKEAGKDYQEIEMIFQQAKDLTTRANNLHLHGRVLSRQKTFIEKNYDFLTTEQIQKQLDDLNYESSDDDESCDSPQTPAIGDEIDLNNITDISDDDDDTKQKEKESRSIRKRTKAFTIKRNNKGETQLHTACIQGNLVLVERLLDQGHAVNVRDNCGWLPIHEACINGHFEIVERLIQKGAAINDRGGTLCNGITPLHDATSNGHLQIIQLLLDKGANVVSKTDEGETPFHFLKRWKSDHEITTREENDIFERIFNRMEQVLEKCGQIDSIEIEKNNSEELKSYSNHRLGTLRRSHSMIIESSEDTESSNQSENELINVKFQYKEVMNNLRNRPRENTFHSINNKSTKRSALLTSDDVDDDWLEDDLGNCSIKKRKINSICSTTNIRRSYDKENRSSDGEMNSLDIPSVSRLSSPLPKTNQVIKRKRQVSLISSGFTRKRSDSSISSSSSPKKSQTRNSFMENSISDKDENNFQGDTSIKRNSPRSSQNEQTVFVDIRILDKLYRVPVIYSEINTLTIQWLAEEASKRYSRKECMKPSLELQTKSGAILAEDDPINILFLLGSTQCEEIIGNVLKWNIQPILERYKESCVSLGLNENSDLSKILRETSTILNLSNKNLESDSITPLCKALNRHVSLVNLDLSGNYGLKEEEINLLSSAFSSFKNLSVLNLSNTNLNESSLGVLAQTFLQTDSSILENLISLDLSYNPIGDEGLPHLAVITRNVKLKSLFLKDVDFTSKIFDNITNSSIELYLDFLQCFDLSYNNLDKNDVIKFVSWIQPSEIETLDISNNSITESGLLMEIVCSFQTVDVVKIKNLNLSRCRTTDSEIYELINLLEKTPTLLNTLNLSYNEEITSISLRRFLQGNLNLKSLILIGCNNFKYFEDSWEVLNKNLISITLNADGNDEIEKLVNMWRKSRVDVKISRDLPSLLKLSTER